MFDILRLAYELIFHPRSIPTLKPMPSPHPDLAESASIVELCNAERAKFGQAPLMLDAKLSAVSQAWAENNAARDVLDHGEFFTRVASRWPTSGEDIEEGGRTAEMVITGWLYDPPHRANIINPAFRKIGVGKAVSKTGMAYWVADFAA